MKFPSKRTVMYKLLVELANGSGTFYQICERAGIQIDVTSDSDRVRLTLDTAVMKGYARVSGIMYSISSSAMRALHPVQPYVGEVAAPHFRGVSMFCRPVAVVAPARRARA